MKPSTLKRIGEALWGSDYKVPMGEALNVSPRNIRRWANGTYQIPPTVASDLAPLLRKRATECETLAEKLEAVDV